MRLYQEVIRGKKIILQINEFGEIFQYGDPIEIGKLDYIKANLIEAKIYSQQLVFVIPDVKQYDLGCETIYFLRSLFLSENDGWVLDNIAYMEYLCDLLNCPMIPFKEDCVDKTSDLNLKVQIKEWFGYTESETKHLTKGVKFR